VSRKGKDGVAIAYLIADDCERIVGWVYLWNTADLGIRWSGRDRDVSFIQPPISSAVLAVAAALGSAELVEFLKALPPQQSPDEN
jgi:hypothetical protein